MCLSKNFYSNFESSPSIDSSWIELSSLPRLGVDSRPVVLKFIEDPPAPRLDQNKRGKGKSRKIRNLNKFFLYVKETALCSILGLNFYFYKAVI